VLPHSVRASIRERLNGNHIVPIGRQRTGSIDSGYGCDSVATLSSVSEGLASEILDCWSTPIVIPTTSAATQPCAENIDAASAFREMNCA
jgi:hypothetical protein